MAQKPARMTGCMHDCPAREDDVGISLLISSAPSPTACEPVAQAETGAFGPRRPRSIAICPLAGRPGRSG